MEWESNHTTGNYPNKEETKPLLMMTTGTNDHVQSKLLSSEDASSFSSSSRPPLVKISSMTDLVKQVCDLLDTDDEVMEEACQWPTMAISPREDDTETQDDDNCIRAVQPTTTANKQQQSVPFFPKLSSSTSSASSSSRISVVAKEHPKKLNPVALAREELAKTFERHKEQQIEEWEKSFVGSTSDLSIVAANGKGKDEMDDLIQRYGREIPTAAALVEWCILDEPEERDVLFGGSFLARVS